MNGTYAAGSHEQTAAGWVILMASSTLAALLVIAGLVYATGTGQRHQVALAAAGCEPGLAPSGLQCTTQKMLTSQYLGILAPASRQVNADTAAYAASEGHDLAVAEAALTAEVAAERAFGTSLAGIEFPPAIVPMARTLIQADRALVELTGEQARSSTLTQLRSFNHRVQAASAAVQTDMRLVLRALRPPPRAS